MKAKKFTPAMRGLAALMTCLMVLSIVGTGVANTYRGALDDTLGTESYVTINDDSAARFKTDYATIEDMAAAARDIAIREGEEGTVVMKNDNGVLPLKANANVALFGLAAYNVYGPKGGNADAASLADALEGAGLTVNATLKDYYLSNIINMHTEMRANRWTGRVKGAAVQVPAGDLPLFQCKIKQSAVIGLEFYFAIRHKDLVIACQKFF